MTAVKKIVGVVITLILFHPLVILAVVMGAL